MMKNIYNGNSSPPKNIFRVENNKPIKVKRAWRAISPTEYVKVWDISENDTTIIRGWLSVENKGLIHLQNSTDVLSTIKKPDLLPNGTFEMNNITFGGEDFTGTIDWGDGIIEEYHSSTQTSYNNTTYYGVVHQYNDDYIIQNTQDNGIWVEVKIKCSLPYISRNNFFAYSFAVLHSIEFVDTIQYFDTGFNFKAIEDFYFTVSKSIYNNVLPSLMYGFSYETNIDLSNSNIKYLGIPRLYSNLNNNDYSYANHSSLWYGTFFNNSKLKTIMLNNNIKLFSDMCFLNDRNLETINIPKSLEYIGYDCFASCTKLQPFILNDGLKYIFDLALYRVGFDIYPIVKPTYPEGYYYLDASRDNYLTYPFETETGMDIFYVPDSVEFIGSQALCSRWWKIVSIGNNIKYLGESFYTQCGTPFHDIIYRGTIDDWFKIKFIPQYTTLNNIIGLDSYFNCTVSDAYFYSNSTGQIYRIICNDGIIINPFITGLLSSGETINSSQYGNNCFDSDGKAIKDNFLILNI